MSARLVPTILVADALKASLATALTANPSAAHWLRHSSASNWMTAPPDSDWNYVHRTVMLGETVLGYVSASVDRDAMVVTEIAAFAVVPGVVFARALQQFVMDLRRQMRAVRWSCVAGSPAELMSRRLAARLDVRIVGWVAAGAMVDGMPMNVTLFELCGGAA